WRGPSATSPVRRPLYGSARWRGTNWRRNPPTKEPEVDLARRRTQLPRVQRTTRPRRHRRRAHHTPTLRPGAPMINPPCDRRWHAGACLTDDPPPQPVGEPHECRQPAGHPPPCRCHWCGTTTTERKEHTDMTEQEINRLAATTPAAHARREQQAARVGQVWKSTDRRENRWVRVVEIDAQFAVVEPCDPDGEPHHNPRRTRVRISPTGRLNRYRLVQDPPLPDHDARVRADERQRMEAAGWRPPIRHGDPHMLAAVYGYELGQEDASRREAEIRADERARVAGAIPGWAHEQEISGYADRWWLKCIWCNDSIKAMRDGDCLEDILTAARDHHRTCAHRLAARQHATTAEGDHHA